ncbi:MAG: hypothetical protein Q8Q07_06145 [Dehalococcoidales bacterium]|nr:hypothetical protein [Dehalococcoidales bacterium]
MLSRISARTLRFVVLGLALVPVLIFLALWQFDPDVFSGYHGELQVVGHLNVAAGEGHITDVWALSTGDGRSYAYLGSYDQPFCSDNITGVYVIDITEPANPRQAGFIPAPTGTRVNDVKTRHIETPFFEGDLLVHSTEFCRGETRGQAVASSPGIILYDVSEPLSPGRLAPDFSLDAEVHNTFIYQQDERAYVLVVQDGVPQDFIIVDITDPSRPVKVTAQGREDWFAPGPRPALGQVPVSLLHDVWAQSYPVSHPLPAYAGRTIAYLSYWDAGLILLDITDPASPVFLGNSDYLDPDPVSGQPPEGNSHVSVPTADGKLLFMGDEDFSTTRTMFTVDTGDFAGEYRAVEGGFTRRLGELDDQTLSGQTVYAGQVCNPEDIPEPPRMAGMEGGFIALIEQGLCPLDRQIANLASAGYDGAIIFEPVGDAGQTVFAAGDPEKGTIPALFVSRFTAFAMLGISLASPADTPLPPPGTPGQRVTARLQFDGWGYGRVMDVADPANIVELGQFATDNVTAQPAPPGDHTMHNVIVDGRRAYISWYADGIRVVDFRNPREPREIAHFVDDVDGSDMWGVYLFKHPDGKKYILGSDRSTGLWIFEAPRYLALPFMR